MARLDRLGPAAKKSRKPARRSAASSAMGCWRPSPICRSRKLREALDRLTNAGLLFVRGTPPDSSYIFKHALVQDAAYGALVRNRRQNLHTRIAADPRRPLSGDRDGATRAAGAALRGSRAGGKGGRLLAEGRSAGAGASAMAEAVAQLRKGLEVLAGLADGPWRQQQELDLQIALGPALNATKGWAAAEVGETLSRARALAEQLDRPEHLVSLVAVQRSFHFVRAEHRLALSLAEGLEKDGEARNDATAQLLARYMQRASPIPLGEFMAARGLFERSMGLADPAHRAIGDCSPIHYACMLRASP